MRELGEEDAVELLSQHLEANGYLVFRGKDRLKDMIQHLEADGYEVATPRSAYRNPLLLSLLEMGGSGSRSEVHGSVGRKMKDILLERDHDPIYSKPIERWQDEVDFVRNGLREQGLIAGGSPSGIWELTPGGRREAERLRGHE